MIYKYILLLIFNLITFFTLYSLANHLNLKDRPNGRKIHKGSIPLIGGLIFYISLIFSLYLFEYPKIINLIIVYSGIIVLTGFFDDFYELKVQTRIIFIFFASYLLISENLLIKDIGEYNNQIFTLGSFGIIFTILCVGGLTNAFNFLDGIDGLLISQVLISHLLLIFFIYISIDQFFITNYFIVIITLCIISLIYNFGLIKNCKIFLGDSGSMFFGFSYAFLLIYLTNYENIIFHKVLVIWTVAFPIFDFFSTISRRIYNKKNPFNPDMTHFHHLIYKKFKNTFYVLFVISILSIMLGIIGYLTTNYLSPFMSIIIFLILTLLFTIYSHFLELKNS